MATDCDVRLSELEEMFQPPTKRHLTQIGYGGPFVVRSNPIGGIFDAIRGFCQPSPMVEDGNGGYTDETGMGFDSPGADFPLLGEGSPSGFAAGYVGGGGPQQQPQKRSEMMPAMMPEMNIPEMMMPEMRCPMGSAFDNSSGICVPNRRDMGMEEMPSPMSYSGEKGCDKSDRSAARARLRMAVANCDMGTAQAVLSYAQGCTSQKKSGTSGSDTKKLIKEAQDAIMTIQRKCQMAERMAPAKQVAIQASSAGSRMTTVDQSQSRRPSLGMGRRVSPQPPSHQSLTEGNVRMRDNVAPMGGMIDPGRYHQPTPKPKPKRVLGNIIRK